MNRAMKPKMKPGKKISSVRLTKTAKRTPLKGAQRVYTKTGDTGSTGLFGGGRVGKNHPRLMAYGALDELNAIVGLLAAHLAIQKGSRVRSVINQLNLIQSTLFVLGSHLATQDETEDASSSARSMLPSIDPEFTKTLETWMDEMSEDLSPLKNFILPGGSVAASLAHVARTVTRRVERESVQLLATETQLSSNPPWLAEVLKGLNRLNDYFFVLARHLNRLERKPEEIWNPKMEAPKGVANSPRRTR